MSLANHIVSTTIMAYKTSHLQIRIMQARTGYIGELVTNPFIKTKNTVMEQTLGVSGSDGSAILQVTYLMEYSSRYGYDLSDYPIYFRDYMNKDGKNETVGELQEGITFDDQFFVEKVGSTVCIPQQCVEI